MNRNYFKTNYPPSDVRELGSIGLWLLLSFLFFASVVSLYLWMTFSTDPKPTSGEKEQETSSSTTNKSGTNKKTSRATTNKSRERERVPDDSKRPVDRSILTVKQEEPGRYRIQLRKPLTNNFSPTTQGELFLFRQEKKLTQYSTSIVLGNNRILNKEFVLGTPNLHAPPGIYRLVASLSSPPPRVLRPVLLTVDVLSSKNERWIKILSGDNWRYEVGFPIGTKDKRNQFRRNTRHHLKTNGEKLLKAWDHWLNVALNAYEDEKKKSEENDDEMDGNGNEVEKEPLPKRLLNSLETIGEQAQQFLNAREHRTKYLLIPYETTRKTFREFATVIEKKVAAMTITVLKQTVGGIPRDWPRKYRVSGFASNLDVRRHMIQYNDNKIEDLRSKLEQVTAKKPRYEDETAYLRSRFDDLHQINNSLQQLASENILFKLDFHLSDEEKQRTFVLSQLFQYLKQRLHVQVSGFWDTVDRFSKQNTNRNDSDLSEDLTSLLEQQLLASLTKLGRKLEITLPDHLQQRAKHLPSSNKLENEIKKLRKKIMQVLH